MRPPANFSKPSDHDDTCKAGQKQRAWIPSAIALLLVPITTCLPYVFGFGSITILLVFIIAQPILLVAVTVDNIFQRRFEWESMFLLYFIAVVAILFNLWVYAFVTQFSPG